MPKAITDLFASEATPEKGRHIYTISEVTRDIKIILENTFGEVWIEAEVSNFKAYPSGHFYFTLKDEGALLAAAMFKNANKAVKFKIEDGLKVICFGRIEVYAPRGQYQLIVEKIEPKGIGAQQLAFEQLKDKLFKEGLFDPKHKKELPLMPFRVGIVTSSAGAAVRDILQILRKGSSCTDVVIRAVRVQGERAAKEIAEAVDDFNQFSRQTNKGEGGIPQNAGRQVDALIICRGGGSTEDLWSFNEEIVARAIYNSRIPTISAVGHQINVTLSDLVADVFVETPSAAAKVIVDKKNALLADLDSYRYELNARLYDVLYHLRDTLTTLKGMLKSPLDRLLEKQQLLDEVTSRMDSHIRHALDMAKEKFNSFVERLEALSPLAVLSRGYSLSSLMPEGRIIKDVSELKPKDLIKTILAKGAFLSSVQEVITDERKTKL
ncbi:MAG: exodeoxyribonuclease VII large subunit [Candidatus Omnitrophica bacterium]|nr:exodeoxyribonuclease VII large subunit [Candidatus Omnitrophota bacterium]MDD5592456.1 exodeoxyribonuclease VII large subunit [Candidatus Omnitrophota bacterium]